VNKGHHLNSIIVFLDDTEFAMQQITAMRAGAGVSNSRTQWVLVACPPRMTRHISRWVNNTARQKWRNKWADNLFNEVKGLLQSPQDLIATELSNGSLVEQTQMLLAKYPAARVLDARRPKFGQALDPLTPDKPDTGHSKSGGAGSMGSLGCVTFLGLALVLGAE